MFTEWGSEGCLKTCSLWAEQVRCYFRVANHATRAVAPQPTANRKDLQPQQSTTYSNTRFRSKACGIVIAFAFAAPHVFQQLFSSCLRSLAVAGGDSGAAGVYACLAGLGEHQRRGVTHPYHKGCRGTEQSVREVSWNIPDYVVLLRFPRMFITLPSFQIFNMFKPTFVSICKKSMRTLRLKLVETRG
jgi:hypothetical protein